MELITKAEFARRMGFSKQMAGKAAKAGRLTLIDDLLPWPKARDEYRATADIACDPRSAGSKAWREELLRE